MFIRQPEQVPFSLSLPAGSLCSNFRAEVTAITAAAQHLAAPERDPPNCPIVILTDSLSTLQALSAEETDHSMRELQNAIQRIATHQRMVLQWIPAHSGIPGNEKADRLAKEGSKKEQPQTKLSYCEAKMVLTH